MRKTVLLLLVMSAAICRTGHAEENDAYLVTRLRDIEIRGGSIPEVQPREDLQPLWFDQLEAMRAYATLDGLGEAYVEPPEVGSNQPVPVNRLLRIAIRTPPGSGPIRGRLFVPKADLDGMLALRFSADRSTEPLEDREAFLRVKLDHYQSLLDRGLPGAAWFRHQVGETRRMLGEDVPEVSSDDRRQPPAPHHLIETYALVTGGQALSETLQLDHLVLAAERDVATVPVDSIEGITVRELDWEVLTAGVDTEVDSLAALIPDDQHAVFLPSLQALHDLLSHAERYGTPVLQAFEPRSQSAMSRIRYERQLGLSLVDLSGALGDTLVGSVAVTGSDAYFRTGTDVAILLETSDVAAVRALIEDRVERAAAGRPDAIDERGEVSGVIYRSFRSPGRSISSYVATVGPSVVVTNSLVQLRQLVEVAGGNLPPLAESPEYRFFRDRYPLGEPETAFVILTDRTIRRWCGPRWRIGVSRRTRAMAVVAEVQADQFGPLVRDEIEARPVYTTLPLAPQEKLTLTPRGVRSSVYGALAFQTPIVELETDLVTEQEAGLYREWLRVYENRWRDAFDPIAARVVLGEDGASLDLSVMPLIGSSMYQPLIDIARGASIELGAADRHPGTLLHVALAINKQSSTAIMGAGMLSAAARAHAPEFRLDPLGWMDETIALYVEDSPLWAELAAAEDPLTFLEEHAYRLPAALHFDVSSGMKLVAFLGAMRGFIEQTAPGMTRWESRTHNGIDYVRVTPSERAMAVGDDLADASVCYAASGQALIISLDEEVLRRALDRQAGRGGAGQDVGPRFGKQVAVQLDKTLLESIEPALSADVGPLMQFAAWNNIVILNEWKRLYPGRDPLEIHERFWQRRLRCPGGGTYHWDERWQTMTSTVYGHPGSPREGPALPEALGRIRVLNAGLTFEHNGLRARVELHEKPAGP